MSLGLLRPVMGIAKQNASNISEVFPNFHLRNTLKAIRCPPNWLPAKGLVPSDRLSEDREGVAWEGEVGDQAVDVAGGTSYPLIPQLSLIKCH
jgi:hypothetical protein